MTNKPPAPPIRQSPSAWITQPPVGEALRQAFRDVADEPVPERLLELIQRLREQEETSG